jgi:hypothetical protein
VRIAFAVFLTVSASLAGRKPPSVLDLLVGGATPLLPVLVAILGFVDRRRMGVAILFANMRYSAAYLVIVDLILLASIELVVHLVFAWV